MAEIKTLKPAGDALVRRPDGQHLSPTGDRVEITSYWMRRLAAGEVVEVVADKPTAKKTGGE